MALKIARFALTLALLAAIVYPDFANSEVTAILNQPQSVKSTLSNYDFEIQFNNFGGTTHELCINAPSHIAQYAISEVSAAARNTDSPGETIYPAVCRAGAGNCSIYCTSSGDYKIKNLDYLKISFSAQRTQLPPKDTSLPTNETWRARIYAKENNNRILLKELQLQIPIIYPPEEVAPNNPPSGIEIPAKDSAGNAANDAEEKLPLGMISSYLGSIAEGETEAISLNRYVSGNYGEPLSFEVVGDRESGIDCTINGQNLSYFAASTGEGWCDIMAIDSTGQSAVGTMSATVVGKNDLKASFKADRNSGNAPLTVNFEAIASGGTAPYFYDWDFEGNGKFERNGRSIEHVYAAAGIYSPKMRVTDNKGNQIVASGGITLHVRESDASKIPDEPPKINFAAYPEEISEGEIVDFEANAIDPEGGEIFYNWEFGDGEKAFGKNTKHTYFLPNPSISLWEYPITLTVRDESGNTARQSGKIKIYRSYLKIIVVKPNPAGSEALEKGRKAEIILSITDNTDAPVDEFTNEPLLEIDGKEVKLERIGAGLFSGQFRGEFLSSYNTPNEAYLYAEAGANILGMQRNAATAKTIRFEPFKLDSNFEGRLEPRGIVKPGELIELYSNITGVGAALEYPNGTSVDGAFVEAVFRVFDKHGRVNYSKSMRLAAEKERSGNYSAKLDYIVQEEDEKIVVVFSGNDQKGNTLYGETITRVSKDNPLFNMSIVEPDTKKAVLFFYGEDAKVKVKVNSTKKEKLKKTTIYLRNDDLNIYSRMIYSEDSGEYESYIRVPAAGQLKNDSLEFTVEGFGYIEGARQEDFEGFRASIADAGKNPIVLQAILIISYLVFAVLIISSSRKEKARIKRELEIEKMNLEGMGKKLKFEFYKRHMTEEEYRKNVLESQQRLETVNELLGGGKKRKGITAAQKREIEANKKAILAEIKKKVKAVEKEEAVKSIGKRINEMISAITRRGGNGKNTGAVGEKQGFGEEELKKLVEIVEEGKNWHSKEEAIEALAKEGCDETLIREVIKRVYGEK